MAISFKGFRFPKAIILLAVRWYVSYPLSYRHIEEMLKERGISYQARIFAKKRHKELKTSGKALSPAAYRILVLFPGFCSLSRGRVIWRGKYRRITLPRKNHSFS